MKCGLGRGIQAPEINSGDSPLAFLYEQLHQEGIPYNYEIPWIVLNIQAYE
jgi:hypothetical protein